MKNIATAPFLGFLTILMVNAQTSSQPTFVGDHPAVKAAVEQYLAEKAATSAKSTGARFAATSPIYGGGYSLVTPPVALRLNRVQYEAKGALQASLIVLPEASNFPTVGISHMWVLIDPQGAQQSCCRYYVQSGSDGIYVLIPGMELPVQTYIFDGREPSGLYAYVVMIHDAMSGQLLAMPGTQFVFRGFKRTDTRWYLRVDNAEVVNDRYVVMKGNFVSDAVLNQSTFTQFVLVGDQKFPIVKADGATAIVDLGSAYALPAGVYDITLVVHATDNTAYDSVTAPGVLRLFLPIPSPPPGKD